VRSESRTWSRGALRAEIGPIGWSRGQENGLVYGLENGLVDGLVDNNVGENGR